MFVGTLRENLALAAPPGAGDDEIRAALDAVDAADWVDALPDGLDTVVGSGGRALTAAQAQQVALARLVLADPHTLVLDEATSLIDPRAARHLERSLAAVLDGRTVIAIAHRLFSAHDADRVAVVEDGRISRARLPRRAGRRRRVLRRALALLERPPERGRPCTVRSRPWSSGRVASPATLLRTRVARRDSTESEAGDADPGPGLVGLVDRDEYGGQRLELAGQPQLAGVDAVAAGDGAGQLDRRPALPSAESPQTRTSSWSRYVLVRPQGDRGDVVEGADHGRARARSAGPTRRPSPRRRRSPGRRGRACRRPAG